MTQISLTSLTSLTWLLPGLCLWSIAGAQTVPVTDEIVVQATRIPKSAVDVPAAVSVVGRDDVQLARQQLGLDESLAAVPGLFMQDRYNFSQDLRIAIRGFGARSAFGIRGVKIIVDGIPETLPDGQGQVDAIDLGSIAQVEVMRGPSSSLYGNASGGVINITTEPGPAEPFTEARTSVGEDDFAKYQVKAGGRAGRLDYLVNASHLDYAGYRDHSATRGSQFNGRFGVDIDARQSLKLVLNITDQPLAQDPGGVTAAQAREAPRSARQRNVDFDAGEALEQSKLGLVYTWSPGQAHELRLRGYAVSRDFSNRLPFTDGGAVTIDRTFTGLGAAYTYRGDLLGVPAQVLLGIDADRQDDDRRRFNNELGSIGERVFDQNELVTSSGVFAQAELSLSERAALTAGLRYDRVRFDVTDAFLADGNDSGERSLSQVSPMLGLVYSLRPALNLYANLATAFETPTTTEFANPDGSGGFNPGLEPQLATNYEVGLKGRVGQRHSLDVAVFRIDVEDELVPFEVAGQPDREFFANAGESRREGAELALVSRPVDGLRLSLAYTWSDFVFRRFVDFDGNDFSGNALPGIPKRFAHAEVNYRDASGWYGMLEFINADALYVDNGNTATSPSYTVGNLRAGFDLTAGRWVVSPFAGVNNLFDERYNGNVRINAFGGRYFEAAPGRNAYGGVTIRYTFGR